MSIEKEVFPYMANDGELYCLQLEGECCFISCYFQTIGKKKQKQFKKYDQQKLLIDYALKTY